MSDLRREVQNFLSAIKADKHDWEDWPNDSRNTLIKMRKALAEPDKVAILQAIVDSNTGFKRETSQTPQRLTDQQIVDQTEELAKFLLSWKYGHKPETNTPLRYAIHPKAEDSWQIACRIQEMLTATDVKNAVDEIDCGRD